MNIKKTVVGLFLALFVVLGIAACSSNGDNAKPVASLATVHGNSTSVALDANFVKALQQLKLTPAPVGSASISSAGVASFPITSGHVKVYKKGDVTPYVQGALYHKGSGLSLTSGSTSVKLTDFVVHPGNNSNFSGDVSLNGKTVASDAKIFDLDGSTLKTPTLSNGVATLTGTTVNLSKDAAALLDKAFNTTAVKGGLKIGIATLKVS